MATKPKAAGKTGRPPIANAQEIKDLICEEIASGHSLVSVLKRGEMPNYKTIMRWINEDPIFCQNYDKARGERADVMFDELDEVAEQAVRASTAVEVAGLRLKADTIKWKLARMNAKKYGERVTTEVSGPDGGPVQMGIKVSFV